MCGYFCIGFIDCMLNFTNLFSLHNSKKKKWFNAIPIMQFPM